MSLKRWIVLVAGVIFFLNFGEVKSSMAQSCAKNNIDTAIFLSSPCPPAIVEFCVSDTFANCLWTFPTSTASALSTLYTFTSGGTYIIPGVITLNNGSKKNISLTVVIHSAPKACFVISSLTGCSPLSIHFDASCTTGGQPPYSSIWDFQDGNVDTVLKGTHIYTGLPGKITCYKPLLIVTDANGCSSDTSVKTNTICVEPKPVACFNISNAATKCTLPDTVCFTNCSSSINTLTYKWSFPGATLVTQGGTTAQNPCAVYSTVGAFSPMLVVTDGNGCTDTVSQKSIINVGDSVTTFTQTADSICLGNSSFSVSAANAGTGGTYSWTCIPAGSSVLNPTSQTTNIDFTHPGTYTITLNEVLQGGCNVSHTSTVFVSDTPVALFSLTPLTVTGCQPPLTITVQNKTTPTPTKWSYNWNFSGATPSVSPPPINTPFSVKFNFCGTYGITLTATNTIGCTNKYSKPIVASINCPSGSVTMDTLHPPLCVPLTVSFKAHPSGNPTDYTYSWDTTYSAGATFAKGTTADSGFVYKFTRPGCDSVAVKMTNNLGCSVVATAPIPVCAGVHFPQPLDFKASPDTTCAANLVTFTVLNQVDSNACRTTYQWFFGDGGNALVIPPGKVTHQYNDTSCFTVKLVRCNCECCDTIIKKALVCILPPIVTLKLSRQCTDPTCIQLSDTGSLGVNHFSWKIDSTTTWTMSNVVNTPVDSSSLTVCFPKTNAAYNVCVTGINYATGCKQKICATAQTIDPIPSFYFSDSTKQCLDDSDFVYNNSVGAANWSWTVTDSLGNQVLSSNQRYLTSPFSPGGYIFPYPGRWTVCLTAIDVAGCKKTLCKNVYVYGLNVGFEAVPPFKGCPPFPVNFQDTTKNNPYGTYVSSEWNFGDPLSGRRDSAIRRDTSHAFGKRGFYTITLCDKDKSGCVSCSSKPQYINVSQPFVNFHSVDSSVCRKDSDCMVNLSNGENPTYDWIVTNSTGQVIDSSHLYAPCFQFNTHGNYQVKLVSVDTLGCEDSLIHEVSVGNLIADFAEKDTFSTCPPLTTSFNFVYVPGADTTKLTYLWSFGDGDFSTLQNPKHTYQYPDSFTVKLVIKNAVGCTDSIVKKGLVIVTGPTAKITISPDTGCVPLNVLFHVVSGNSINYTWSFGDGTLETSYGDTTYTYTKPGIRTATVLLSDGKQCEYTLPLKNVYVDSVFARFNLSSRSVCQSGVVTLTDSSYIVLDTLGPPSCSWDFGDGSTSNSCITSHIYNGVGTFHITLTVTSVGGCVSTATDSVMVKNSPQALAIVSKNIVCPGDSVCFTNNSSSVSPIDSVFWNFGDALNPANDTSTLRNPCHPYKRGGDYTIVLMVKANNACTDTAQYHVHVNTPLGIVGPDTAVCLHDSIQLNASGGVSYQWSPATGLSATNIPNPYASPTVLITYTVLVIDNAGCTADDSEVVSVHKLPQPQITFKDSTCSGSPDTLNASGGVSYLWSTGQTTAVINPIVSNTDTFIVAVTDINHCSADTFAAITVKPLPIVNTSSDTGVCKGDTLLLHAKGGVSYLWTSASSGIVGNPDSPSIHVVIEDTSIYSVAVTSNLHCTAHAQVKVIMYPLPIVSAGPDVKICSGNNVELHGSGAVSYIWSPANLFLKNTIQNPIAEPQSPVTEWVVSLKGTDANGCVNYDTTIIRILYPFTMKVIPDTCICYRSCAVLYAITDTVENYLWSPPIAIQNANTARPTVCPVNDTIYQVIASDGLCYADTGKVKICINPLPVVTAYPKDTIILAGSQATLGAISTIAGSYSWKPDTTVKCDTCQYTWAYPAYVTTYIVTETDINSCRGTDTAVVRVFCSDASIFIPNAFSPNGDGKNDVFMIKGDGFTLQNFRIYDRWGKEVFETHDISQGWDGTYKGKLYEPGVFVYDLQAICSSGMVISKKGNITLVR